MKIIKVVDTREKVEVPGPNGKSRFVGIPKTGIERECDLCESIHEIHVYVELDDKSQMIVGQGCGNKTWPNFAKQLKIYSDMQELEILKPQMMGYKFEKVEFHPLYKIKQWFFEIDEKKFHPCIKGCETEKEAVMYIVKKNFKSKKEIFAKYFRIMDRIF